MVGGICMHLLVNYLKLSLLESTSKQYEAYCSACFLSTDAKLALMTTIVEQHPWVRAKINSLLNIYSEIHQVKRLSQDYYRWRFPPNLGGSFLYFWMSHQVNRIGFLGKHVCHVYHCNFYGSLIIPTFLWTSYFWAATTFTGDGMYTEAPTYWHYCYLNVFIATYPEQQMVSLILTRWWVGCTADETCDQWAFLSVATHTSGTCKLGFNRGVWAYIDEQKRSAKIPKCGKQQHYQHVI